MIAALLESQIVVDGAVVTLEHIAGGIKLRCHDGSEAELRHYSVASDTYWTLDVYDGSGELIVDASSRWVAEALMLEPADGSSMIYELLYLLGCALRYGWWTYSVICWDEGEGLKLVHRDHAGAHRVVLDIIAVAGERYDEEG